MRSRIPRFVLYPLHTKAKEPLVSNLPLSEEESSQHSKRTFSPNSLSSDDTGCPSSQCASPSKTHFSSESSPVSSPYLEEHKMKVKRVRMNTENERSKRTQMRTRDKQQCMDKTKRGSETDFSSSSGTGSYRTHVTQLSSSAGKVSSSRSRGPPIRSLPVFKPVESPLAARDAEQFSHYRMAPNKTSCVSSSARRRTTPVRYHSCGDNHGIKPPAPEQYLTPLQQKEVSIRHLKSKLQESQNTVTDRESEIEELKSQMGRMREDWIEEECHRVEAQLALKEARKEIKQLRQVVETMKNSLMEKDKGIQKYFIDINIQNRKLESLLHSMELAQSGSSLQDELTLDFMGESLERSSTLAKLDGEAQADNTEGSLEQVLMSTAVDSSTKIILQPGLSCFEPSISEKSREEPLLRTSCVAEEKGIQTDEVIDTVDLQTLLYQLLKLQGGLLIPPNRFQDFASSKKSESHQEESREENVDGVISTSTTSIAPTDSGLCLSEPSSPPFMEELNFDLKDSKSKALVGKNHWSNNFLVDLVAVAAPVLPTVAWLYSQHGLVGGAPVYNIAALIRGCCIMGLHSLRHVSHGPDT